MKVLVTGGAGFIGSAVIREFILHTDHIVLNLDALTYAGNLNSLATVSSDDRYSFVNVDLRDSAATESAIFDFKPDVIMHLAAESHVDRSIERPNDFITTNVIGTFNLLEASRKYLDSYPEKKNSFKFHHISTDEVYGDLGFGGGLFTEETSYDPSSPYSASKASSDHLVRAWGRTYCLPTVVTNCSNNYGPYHFPEKLIPHMILNAIHGESLPVYGDGMQVRDWLYVEDHARALIKVAEEGVIGETYNIGGFNERTNIDVVRAICSVLEEIQVPKPMGVACYEDLITHVNDRPGHDVRYAIDASKIERELGWFPKETFESGIRKTVTWYLDNEPWWRDVLAGNYRLERIGGK